MGALGGTLTYTSYLVLDEPSQDFKQTFIDGLNARCFRDIEVGAGQVDAFGWVSVDDLFATEFDWADVFRDPYICFSLREDRIKLPATVIKAHIRKREREYLKETGQEALSRSERGHLKEDVLLQLRRRAIPDIKVIDIVWNPLKGTLRFWTHSKRYREIFEELFVRTWGLNLIQQSPYALSVDGAEDADEKAKQVLDIVPASLVEVVS